MMPKRPNSASFGARSSAKCAASSHSITCGRISPSANSRTVRRSCSCSSVSLKSTPSPTLLRAKPESLSYPRLSLDWANRTRRLVLARGGEDLLRGADGALDLFFAHVVVRHHPHLLRVDRSEEHTSELQSQSNLVCRLLPG